MSHRRFRRAAAVVLGLVMGLSVTLSGAAQAEPDCDVPDPPPVCDPDRSPPRPQPRAPFGFLDAVETTANGSRVVGWAIDPDSTSPASIEVRVDGGPPQTFLAGESRPDVGAAFPASGSLHGFAVNLTPRRHSIVCVTARKVPPRPGAASPGPPGNIGCGRAKNTISVFNLNIRGMHEKWATNNDGSGGITKIPWRDRYKRVAAWMSGAQGRVTWPDFIALQELPALKQWTIAFPIGPNFDPRGYESLDILINEIKSVTGKNYRIAYLSADYVHEGNNPLYQGRALLYNAGRVRNTTAATAPGTAVDALDQTRLGTHVRASFPCFVPPNGDTCGLIDGDGRHWTAAHIDSRTGAWARGAAAATFELVDDPGNHILVVNVHQHPDDKGDGPALRDLIDSSWRALRLLGREAPPIVVGDFNGDPESLSDFDVTFTHDVDFTLMGRSPTFIGKFDMTAETERVPDGPFNPGTYCGTISTVLSDHCGSFAQYFPVAR
jgi:hypothetical protein